MYFPSIAEITKKWAESRKKEHAFWFTTGSTNENAKKEGQRLLSQIQLKFILPHFKLYIAQHQSFGKGRYQRSWFDEGKGGELLSSWLFLIPFSPQYLSSLFAGLALFESVSQTWPHLAWSLKPPNDLYLYEKKVAGLLIESFSNQEEKFCLTIGLGFNVLSFPKREKNATCLGEKNFSIEKYFVFLDFLFKRFLWVSQHTNRTYLKEKERALLIKALKAYPGGQYKDISQEGHIITKNKETLFWQNL